MCFVLSRLPVTNLIRKYIVTKIKGKGMKYLLFIVLLVAVVITAGCFSGNQNTPVTPTPQIVYVTVLVTPTPTIITPSTTAPVITTSTQATANSPHSIYMYQIHRANPNGGLSINIFEYYEEGYVCTNPEISNVNYKNGVFGTDRNLDESAFDKEQNGFVGIWCEKRW
jgi:hypothetical protein